MIDGARPALGSAPGPRAIGPGRAGYSTRSARTVLGRATGSRPRARRARAITDAPSTMDGPRRLLRRDPRRAGRPCRSHRAPPRAGRPRPGCAHRPRRRPRQGSRGARAHRGAGRGGSRPREGEGGRRHGRHPGGVPRRRRRDEGRLGPRRHDRPRRLDVARGAHRVPGEDGRVESVAREVERPKQPAQVQEMLAVLLRPEGIGAGALPWESVNPAAPRPAPPAPAPRGAEAAARAGAAARAAGAAGRREGARGLSARHAGRCVAAVLRRAGVGSWGSSPGSGSRPAPVDDGERERRVLRRRAARGLRRGRPRAGAVRRARRQPLGGARAVGGGGARGGCSRRR